METLVLSIDYLDIDESEDILHEIAAKFDFELYVARPVNDIPIPKICHRNNIKKIIINHKGKTIVSKNKISKIYLICCLIQNLMQIFRNVCEN